MVRHLRGLLERPLVLEVGGDPGRAESMIADRRRDPGLPRPPADHLPGVRLGERPVRQRFAVPVDGPEHDPLAILPEAAAVEIVVEVGLEGVVAGHLVPLAALLVEPHPQPPVLGVEVLDLQRERGTDAGEAVDHQSDQRPVAEPDRFRRVDRVEELSRLGRLEHRRLAAPHDVARPAHGGGRVHRHDLADDKPVEEGADRGEALLHRRDRLRMPELLDEGRHMDRLHASEGGDAARFAPGAELDRTAQVGAAGVRVADVDGEELEEAGAGAFVGGGEQDRQRRAGGAGVRTGNRDRGREGRHPVQDSTV